MTRLKGRSHPGLRTTRALVRLREGDRHGGGRGNVGRARGHGREHRHPSDRETRGGTGEVTHYLLSVCETVGDVAAALAEIRVVPVTEDSLGFPAPLHFAAVDPAGASVVVEIIDGGRVVIHDNPLGVITNAPTFDWHMINLRNYINLSAVDVPPLRFDDLEFAPLSAGSGMRGLPGDNTSPSRFVRALAATRTARATVGGLDTVREVMRILDNFQLSSGTGEGSDLAGSDPLPSATQWTTAADTGTRAYYYRTAWNRRLRRINLGSVDFAGGDVRYLDMDDGRSEDVHDLV